MGKIETTLKQYREEKGLTQKELAEKVGVRRETILHLENNRYNPSLELALEIARVFGVTVETLFKLKY
ncbi:cro/CI family transcriptional regulator [Enterococcus sp. 7E2_DIV0204]|uniref:HTH cro/C1-type domain-containing protein n=1 Tax=Candidatus Enterococcus lemimoniae TaxID=1834167 RepID=A0ABZ2T8V3_9ENTE|nr:MULTISPECIES: helix-turn-helix transcriptional regulator [unclassified Enterococcus]OTN89352.1 cro/CI family transcriptional regulator [Enterococcus sp. 7E2_DIV0204]OTO68199.1 cro/CI family transcriptional regulator [Enterococcus sp. 12C11_DIV0727]OTP51806.1 cro/CI family transcriptional regulator [Enterococcus sp. 7D2_DIV0200]